MHEISVAHSLVETVLEFVSSASGVAGLLLSPGTPGERLGEGVLLRREMPPHPNPLPRSTGGERTNESRGAAVSVRAVRIRLGTLSAIVPAALQSGFAIATRDTPLEGARLDIQPVAPMIWCAHCGGERGVLDPPRLRCADCGNRADRLTRGRELELVRIELNDPAPEVALAAENRRGPSTDP